MPKTLTVVVAAILTIVAVSFLFKSSVSQTVAGVRDHVATTISVQDMHRNADAKSMPVMKVNDRSFVFTDNE